MNRNSPAGRCRALAILFGIRMENERETRAPLSEGVQEYLFHQSLLPRQNSNWVGRAVTNQVLRLLTGRPA